MPPDYAPGLNPEEGIWQQLKATELRNVCCLDLRPRRPELRDVALRARRKPHIIQGKQAWCRTAPSATVGETSGVVAAGRSGADDAIGLERCDLLVRQA